MIKGRKSWLMGMIAIISLPAFAEDSQVTVSAAALNVRNERGAILCAVPRGTTATAVQRHGDGRRVLIRFTNPPRGCPAEGLVYSDFLSAQTARPAEAVATVDVNGLALRSAPEGGEASYRCSLPQGARVIPLGSESSRDDVTWIKVRLNPARPGCPEEGYVAKFYLVGVNSFTGLPVLAAAERSTGDCPGNNCGGDQPQQQSRAVGALDAVGSQIGARIPDGANRQVAGQLNPRAARLAQEARNAAARCRQYAPFVCRYQGHAYPCGSNCNMSQSKGWCKAAVREAVTAALGVTVTGSTALQARDSLNRHFTRLSVSSCAEAPVGAICLYGRPAHDYGHIEIKADNSLYCSDYCAARPLRNGVFQGAWLPDFR